MLILVILFGAAAFYVLQLWVYSRLWDRSLTAGLSFLPGKATEGDEAYLLEKIENRKLLPLPMLKVKFQVSRKLAFKGEGDSSVTDQYYKNDIFSLGPRERVTKKLSFRCTARGYYRINGMDMVCADLFLSRESVKEVQTGGSLYVYPRPAGGVELDSAIRKLSGEILTKRHIQEDPFEYQGIREYAPYDSMKAINWKATARMDELMVNVRGYTALRAVRIFLNLEDSGILRQERLIEISIRIAVRIAGDLLDQGIRIAFYCNGKDILNQEAARLQPSAGSGHMESINRTLARIDLTQGTFPLWEVFAGELEEQSGDIATVFISMDRSRRFQELLDGFASRGDDFVWFCPLMPGMDGQVEDPDRLHFVRLNGEAIV